ncbi:MAG: DUF2561 family protein [Mycobacterium sp.]
MTSETAPAGHETTATGRSPETVDRIMVGVCGATWLVLLAASVVAIVGLVRLGSGHSGGGERHSSWLLYSVIVVSALIIIGAIPLLLRARRNALAEPPEPEAGGEAEAARTPVEAPTEKMRVFGVDPYAQREVEVSRPAPLVPTAVLDRIWLRGTTSLLTAMGLALTAVAAATYLLADGKDTGAWVALGLAGVITIAMPAILVLHKRMLTEAVDEAA